MFLILLKYKTSFTLGFISSIKVSKNLTPLQSSKLFRNKSFLFKLPNKIGILYFNSIKLSTSEIKKSLSLLFSFFSRYSSSLNNSVSSNLLK